LFAQWIEDAGHPNFFPNNTFHGRSICACKVIGTVVVPLASDALTMATSIPVCYRPFPFWGSTGSKQTLNGLFYVSQPELFFSDESKLRDSNIFNL
jgi:hypothetical protein